MNDPKTMTQDTFWKLDEVIRFQTIQKLKPYGSSAHRLAFEGIKNLLAEIKGPAFAEDYMGNYTD